jgi:ATP-dependent 26S proteasome regulatory subunit
MIDEEVNLEEVVVHIPENFTGADFGALTTETYMLAVKQKIESLEQ